MDNEKVIAAIHELSKEFSEFKGHTNALLEQIIQNTNRRLDGHSEDIDEIKDDITELREQAVEIRTEHDSEIRTAKLFGGIGIGILMLIEIGIIVFTFIRTSG